MSTQNIILSQRPAERAGARFRDKAKGFIGRHKGVAYAELLMMALLFAVPFFTFSSGILGFSFVLMMIPEEEAAKYRSMLANP